MKITALLEHIKNNRSTFKGLTNVELIELEAQLSVVIELHPELEELEPFFDQNLEANNFKIISKLAQAKDFFTKTFLADLNQKAIDKLEKASTALSPPYGDFSKILYVKERDFYVFLNHLKNPEIEEKLKEVLEKLLAIYRQNSGSEIAGKAFIAVNNYKALDPDLASLIHKTKYSSEVSASPFLPKRTKLYFIYGAVLLFVVVRLFFFIAAIRQNHNYETNDYDSDTEYKPEPRKIDRYYTNMKFAIDSFQVFLADYNASEIKQMTRDISLKTGENPFETFYQNPPAGESNNFIKVKNNTIFDMVLLENSVLYDTIKIPRTAHFIKAGDALEVNFNRADSKTIFNIYMGNKWATFQTNSRHMFIRNHSIVEYRFSELIPAAKAILKTDYSFVNDAVISYSKSGLDIESKNAKVNPLDELKE